MGREVDRTPLSRFSHTSNFCYLTACFALCCVGYDSTHVSAAPHAATLGPRLALPLPRRPPSFLPPLCRAPVQDVIERSHINKKWFYLFGM